MHILKLSQCFIHQEKGWYEKLVNFFETHKFLSLGCQKRYTSINSNGNMQATTYIYIKLTESHKVFISELNTSRCSKWKCSFLSMWKLENYKALDHDKFSLKILDLSQITSSLQLFPKELSFMTPRNNILTQ